MGGKNKVDWKHVLILKPVFPVLTQEIEGEKHAAISTSILPLFPYSIAGAPQLLPHRVPRQMALFPSEATASFLTISPLFDPGLPMSSWEKMPLQAPPASQFYALGTSSLATDHSSSPLHLNPATCARKAVPTDSLIRTSNDSLN